MPDERPTGMARGDARLGNMVVHDDACRAVLDWETVSLGGAGPGGLDLALEAGRGGAMLEAISPTDMR